MTQTPPSLQEQAEFNDRWNQRCGNGSFDELPAEVQAQGSMVMELLRSLDLKSPVILEVGSGTGWLTEKLVQFGACTAVDLSSRAIETARQRGFAADLIAGDFLEVNLPCDHFDICTSIGSIAYFTDQVALFDKVAALLKSNGYLILTTNNRFVFERRGDVPPPEPGQVRNWLSRTQLRKLLRRHFEVLDEYTMFPAGDRGILRLVNSTKINSLLRWVLSDDTITRAKERMGLGHCRVVVARRRSA